MSNSLPMNSSEAWSGVITWLLPPPYFAREIAPSRLLGPSVTNQSISSIPPVPTVSRRYGLSPPRPLTKKTLSPDHATNSAFPMTPRSAAARRRRGPCSSNRSPRGRSRRCGGRRRGANSVGRGSATLDRILKDAARGKTHHGTAAARKLRKRLDVDDVLQWGYADPAREAELADLVARMMAAGRRRRSLHRFLSGAAPRLAPGGVRCLTTLISKPPPTRRGCCSTPRSATATRGRRSGRSSAVRPAATRRWRARSTRCSTPASPSAPSGR